MVCQHLFRQIQLLLLSQLQQATQPGRKLDCVEEREGQLFGYEFKWQGQVRAATQQEFTAAYPGAEVATITRENFTDFIG